MAKQSTSRILAATIVLLALAGCNRPDASAWYNRGGPEALLDVSNEVVNLSITGPDELIQLSKWVKQDAPTRAELYCTAGEKRCTEARKLLELQGVNVMEVPSPNNMVALVYERILARDCNQRFIDNHNNNYNAPHPALGCSISANIVQHVSDKQQFVNPSLSDTPRAAGGMMAYERAYAPSSNGKQQDGGIKSSLVGSATTN